LGHLAFGQILPAFGKCKYARPTALVSGDPDKAAKVAAQYGIPAKSIYNYKNFDEIKNNKDIDVVYVVLPNSMHAEFTIRAAQAGKHVLCEKPMSVSSAEAQRMIDSCKKQKRKLMIGYRIICNSTDHIWRGYGSSDPLVRGGRFYSLHAFASWNGCSLETNQRKILAAKYIH
jgi:predicted dehydrogenase